MPNPLHGNGPDLHSAIQNAWGKRGSGDPTEFVVAEITVTGNNPLTGYTVVLNPK
jgi:hypothetical protein